MSKLRIVECPRDAMQGIHDFIPTELKVKYLNALLAVGFDTLDFGSFVSPKAIPQLKDTAEVVPQLIESPTKLLAIVANERGAEEAGQFDRIYSIGFPFSVSEQFQIRNTNTSRKSALGRVKEIQRIAEQAGQALRLYLSMAFGNPYGEEWSPAIVQYWAEALVDLGAKELVLSDTVGAAKGPQIEALYLALRSALPSQIELSCHFHSRPDQWEEKVAGAAKVGCKGFDGALKGFGGCPMADDDLVGNIATEHLMNYFVEELKGKMSQGAIDEAAKIADEIFLNYQ